jgi:hypothetical protein
MDRATEPETAAFLERLFATELDGHSLITNRSIWRQFPTIRTTPWWSEKIVLLGDAAHTAHFSVGSGTRMAMEDAVALRDALVAGPDVPAALHAYEASRRPQVESLQRAAQASLQWFEDTERYMSLEPVQFVFSLLTRSLRITHEDLRARDPQFLRGRRIVRAAERQVRQPSQACAKRRTRPRRRAGFSRRARASGFSRLGVPRPCSRRSAPRPGAAESRRRLADVPVRGGRWADRRLAPGSPRKPRDRRRRVW